MYFLSKSESFQHLTEMGMCRVSAKEDNLPFKIILMNPDTNASAPHAHILELGRNGKEIGTFEITKACPQFVDDLREYVAGKHKGLKNISLDDRQRIVDWAGQRSRLLGRYTNWETLQSLFYVNAYAGRCEP